MDAIFQLFGSVGRVASLLFDEVKYGKYKFDNADLVISQVHKFHNKQFSFDVT